MSTESLLSEVRKLSIDERIQFVEKIYDGIYEDDPEFIMSDELRQELDRRLADYEAHPETASTWAEVKARLLKQSP